MIKIGSLTDDPELENFRSESFTIPGGTLPPSFVLFSDVSDLEHSSTGIQMEPVATNNMNTVLYPADHRFGCSCGPAAKKYRVSRTHCDVFQFGDNPWRY